MERPFTWAEMKEIALEVEACGFDSIWMGDHLLYRDEQGVRGPREVWTSLAALAEATERVALGPLVAATAFHNPAMLAKLATTVDDISGGRLVLGLGAGWNQVEFSAFGFPYDRRVDRFAESYQIITTLIRTGGIDHQGEFFTLREMQLEPKARSDIPIMIGSNGDRMLRLTMGSADAWNSWFVGFGNRASGLGPLLDKVDAACRDVGRDPADVERTVAVCVQTEGGAGRKSDGSGRNVPNPIAGSREAIAHELSQFESAGIGHIQVVLDPIDARSVTELAEAVALL